MEYHERAKIKKHPADAQRFFRGNVPDAEPRESVFEAGFGAEAAIGFRLIIEHKSYNNLVTIYQISNYYKVP